MKKVSVSDLCHRYPEIERVLDRGCSFEITKYGRVVGRLLPVDRSAQPTFPDFAARAKKIFGNKKLKNSGTEMLRRKRDTGLSTSTPSPSNHS